MGAQGLLINANAHALMFSTHDSDAELRKPRNIIQRRPLIGNQNYCIQERGIFVLERGPASLIGIACPHAGSGGWIAYDGVPDDTGHFPFSFTQEYIDHFKFDVARLQANETLYVQKAVELVMQTFQDYNGRILIPFYNNVMGMWMFNSGCFHGITIRNHGEMTNLSPIIAIQWMRPRQVG